MVMEVKSIKHNYLYFNVFLNTYSYTLGLFTYLEFLISLWHKCPCINSKLIRLESTCACNMEIIKMRRYGGIFGNI